MRNLIFMMAILTAACTNPTEKADLVLTGGTIYTLDEEFSTARAVAIKNGRILATGTEQEIEKRYEAAKTIDLQEKFLYPGWIDPHCHFTGYGMNLAEVDLAGTSSVEEILKKIKAHQEENAAAWITGRGWDQNDWEVMEFPDKSVLDHYFPDTPVLLRRIDGHAAWANSKALALAGVTAKSQVAGGTVMVKNGEATGILIDNAIELVSSQVPSPTPDDISRALLGAQERCFAVGLTSVQDAGLDREIVDHIHMLHQGGELKMRINAWLSPTAENFEHFVKNGPRQDESLSINTIKLFADGALGSRGALMTEDYSDDPGNRGLQLTSTEDLERYCRMAYENNFSVATHCIGDAANRLTLNIYAGILGGANDRRWRIEHSQVIHPDDVHLFGDYNIIPSVQATHATSDMYWAGERLGTERLKSAYAYRELLEENGWLTNGSDFPVESINPLYGFYAAVARKDQRGWPAEGFQAENALSREQALRAMTIWAARAGREENLKGSIEAGKLADFTITASDLMEVGEEELFSLKVIATISGGELVYGDL